MTSFAKPCSEDELNTLSFNEPQQLIGALENYVEEQNSTNSYDFIANKKLLKLYQYYPDSCNGDIVAKVMVLSLMRLPSSDYLALSCLAAGRTSARNSKCQEIQTYAEMLESGRFKEFWTARNSGSNIITNSKFDESIRSFIISTVGLTFQNIKVTQLSEMLGLSASETHAFAAGKCEINGENAVFNVAAQSSRSASEVESNLRLEEVVGLMDAVKGR
mmetsp:Transcript_100464/g.216668  ORF Transcript_100464/g.216668 Transcript_100464/m.216668 type:complete len:218 (-) Transcript_100464:48-701(-)